MPTFLPFGIFAAPRRRTPQTRIRRWTEAKRPTQPWLILACRTGKPPRRLMLVPVETVAGYIVSVGLKRYYVRWPESGGFAWINLDRFIPDGPPEHWEPAWQPREIRR